MALLVFTDAFILINAVNMSAMAKECSLEVEAEALDSSAFGSGWKGNTAGLKSGNFGIKFNQDFAAAQVDALLWPLFGTNVAFELRPTSAARSATNPAYTGTLLIKQYTPLVGQVGALVEPNFTWPTSGTVSRATS